MIEKIVTFLHLGTAVAAYSAWALGMYYWWITNNSLNRGISKFSLLNPAAYFKTENFTEAGIHSRNKVIMWFIVMVVLVFVGYGLRLLKEALA